MAGQGDRFRRRALSRGYKVDEVDAFLDRVEATLAGEPMGAPVPSQEVDDVVFRVRFGGYDEWQVDVYLDRIARQLSELEERGVLGRAPSPEFAGGPAGNPSRDMPMRDSGPVPMHDGPMRDGPPMGPPHDGPMGPPMRGDGPMRDGPMGPPMRGDGPMPPHDGPMGPPMRGDGPMSPPRDFGPPRDMPMRDTPPPPDMTMPMRAESMPPRDMPMRDTPGPMREPSPPRDMPMRQQSPMHGGADPTMAINHVSPPHDLPPMRDEPSTPPPMNRRSAPPPPPPPGAGPPPIEDDGEGFGHLRPDDGEGFGHLRGGDDFDDPFPGHRGRLSGGPPPPAGFESAAPMSGPPNPPDGRFGGPPPPPDDRFGGPPPDDRFGGPPPPPPDDRFGGPPPPPQDDRFGGPPPPDDRFGGPPPDDRFGGPPPPPDDRFGGPPPPDDRFGPPPGHFEAEPRTGGMMPPPPAAPPPGHWGEPVSPAGPPGFDRRPPEPFDQGDDMTRPLRRPPMADPPPTMPDSELTQRLRRGGEDRFGAPPPPPPGRGGPPPRDPGRMEPPTPPRGISGDPDIPTAAHPVVQGGGRPPSPYDDPQGFRDGPPPGPDRGDGRMDPGRRNPYEGRPYEGRGVFDEPGRHGRDEMTTEMNAGDSPFQPSDVQRVEQLRSSFKPRRFGSGYDPVQVTRIFDAMSSNMTKRSPVPVTDKELDTRQFSLVQQGYFEPEVDAALREVRDIFAKRGMIRD